jgi:1,4-alpha-glucan branching enzyme
MKMMNVLGWMLLFFSAAQAGCVKCPDPKPEVTETPDSSGYTQYGVPVDSVPNGREMVMYEVNLRAFSASGDLQGVLSRIDELDSLGINTIWLMPIHPIGTVNSVNSPYSVKDFKAVGAEFGSLEDLRELTDAAHSKGMFVIMDWVANHTAWDNAWVTAHPDWYTQDANGNIIWPAGTNWQDVADLNYDDNEMRLAMIDALKFWVMEANVDGYRCDHADGVPNDFWQSAIDELRALPNRKLIFLAEGSGVGLLNAGFDMTFGWDFYNGLKNVYNGSPASGLLAIHNAEYTSIPIGKHRLRFTTNHDESAWDASPITLFGGIEGAKTASAISIFTGGVPMLYSGQEVGRASTTPFFSNSPINWTSNPGMLQFYQDLMHWYNNNDVVKRGFVSSGATANVFALKKNWNGNNAVIIANVRNSNQTFSVPLAWQGTWNDALTGSVTNLGATITLSPYQTILLQN